MDPSDQSTGIPNYSIQNTQECFCQIRIRIFRSLDPAQNLPQETSGMSRALKCLFLGFAPGGVEDSGMKFFNRICIRTRAFFFKHLIPQPRLGQIREQTLQWSVYLSRQYSSVLSIPQYTSVLSIPQYTSLYLSVEDEY